MSVKEKFDYRKHKLIISLTDSYKLGRHKEYPEGIRYVNETLVARGANFEDSDMNEFVVFGTSYARDKIQDLFRENFFNLDYDSVEEEMRSFIQNHIPGGDSYTFDHWKQLYKLGRLPLKFTGVPEGTILPIGTPFLEIINTDERFFWLPNFIETIFLSYVWPCVVSASRAYKIAKMAVRFAVKQGIDVNDYIENVLPFQFHDFSMRGQKGLDACEQTGMGHLCVFSGSDNMYAIQSAKIHYCAELSEVGKSIPAVEHSSTTSNICSSGGDLLAELNYIEKLLTSIYPGLPVSYVCDSYDFWGVVSHVIPNLKEILYDLPEKSKLVVRPDSGDPVDILCGKSKFFDKSWVLRPKRAEKNGLIRCLVDFFGSERNGIHYLSDRVGIVYGDGMNYDRISKILNFMVSNDIFIGSVVFGLGAVQQGFYTRDNLGIALKTTCVNINGDDIDVYKNPKTSSGINKKSPKGRVCVGYKYKNMNGCLVKEIIWVDSDSNESIDEMLWTEHITNNFTAIRNKIYFNLKMYAEGIKES